MNINFGLAGLYQLEKLKVDADGNDLPGTRQVLLPWFDNLVTDIGMNLLGSAGPAQDNLAYCRIGVGNANPAYTDTALVSQTGYTNTVGSGGASGLSVDGTYIYRRVRKRFAAGTISGVNLAEVGMSYAGTGNNLFSRSLLKDISGNPTTITLLPDEVLDVIYELRQYLPPQDIVVNTIIDGAPATVTIRRSTQTQQVNNWAAYVGYSIHPDGGTGSYTGYAEYDGLENPIAAATGWGNTGSAYKATKVTNAYVANSYQRTVTLTFPLTVDNYSTGLGFITIGTGSANDSRSYNAFGPWGLIFNPKLNKTDARIATVTFGVSWARHTP